MADLSEKQAAGATKVTGSSLAGSETNYVNVDANGNMNVIGFEVGVVGSAIPTDAALIAGKDLSGNLRPFLVDTNGNQIVLLKDANGNNIMADNGQILSQDTLFTGGQNRAQSVTTTAAEALGAATILANRKVLTLTPTNGTIYWGFTSGVTTTTGLPIFTNQSFSIAATDAVHIYVVAAATTDVRIAEGA